MPLCSVIVCTYNRADLVQRLLRSLAGQTIAPSQLEIVVVDDGSRDNTSRVCTEMQSQFAHFKYIALESNRGLAAARNAGIAASSGEYLLFTDDDCIPAEDWAGRLRDALREKEIVSGAIASKTTNFVKLCHNIAQFHSFMPGRKAGEKEMLAGANMAFRRSVLEGLEGFRAGIPCADDTEIALRARAKGHTIFFVPDAVVVHDPDRTSLSTIVRYAAHHAAVTIHMRNSYRELLKTPALFRSAAFLLAVSPLIALRVTASIYFGNSALAKFFWTAPLVFLLKLAWCWGAAHGLRQPPLNAQQWNGTSGL